MYYSSAFASSKNDPKKTWDIIRELVNHSKVKKRQTPESLTIGNKTINDIEAIPEKFDNFFGNIAENLANSLPKRSPSFINFLKHRNKSSIFLEAPSSNEIFNIIQNLNVNKSPGFDDVSSFFLRIIAVVISPYLSILFSCCFDFAIFPDCFKIAKVIPIYKAGLKSKLTNYRPISLLSNFSKILEKIIAVRILAFLDKHSVFYKRQFGFRKKHSTIHAVTDIITQCYEKLESKLHCCLILLDIKKAFDSIDHQILIEKLNHYGIRGVANELIKSYLSDRFQYVELDNVKSSRINIKYGVPQGSILGPLLFILYINDLPNSLINQPTLFADDTCILISNHSLVNLGTQSNDELKSVSEWMIANRLTLNSHKTQALVLTRSKQKLQPFLLSLNNIFIEIRQSVKYLGIHLDSTLNFTSHIQMVERRVSTAIGILCKLKSMAPVKILLSVYYAIVFPHLMYGILLWGCSSKNNLHKLQMLQNKCLRIIEGWQIKQKLEPLFIKFKIFNIDQLLNFEIAKFMFLYQRNKLPQLFNNYFSYIKVITSRQTRKADKDDLYLPLHKTKRAQKSIKYVGVKIWNDIPLKIRTLPFNKFKQKYKLHLFQKSATTQK